MNPLARSALKVWLYGALAQRILSKKPTFTVVREGNFLKWWSAAAAELGADLVDLGQGYSRISKGGRSTIVQAHFLQIDTYMNRMLVGNKPFVHRLLQCSGYRVPQYAEYTLDEIEKAYAFMENLGGRCVVKPSSGAGGNGVTTGINSRQRLRQAAIASGTASFQQQPMIEEEFEGDSYRLLFLDGKLIDAVKRCRPTVIGDGKSTIRQLIAEENKQRLGSGPSRAFSFLTIDLDCKLYLKDAGLGLTHVPAAGEVVTVKNVANQNSARDNFTVRDQVHSSFLTLGKQISSLLGTKLIGLDLMTRDISVSLDESGGAINEINIPPGLHYHELIANPEKKADVFKQILDYVLTGVQIGITVPDTSFWERFPLHHEVGVVNGFGADRAIGQSQHQAIETQKYHSSQSR